jgi:ParB family chromosome partitioning protein
MKKEKEDVSAIVAVKDIVSESNRKSGGMGDIGILAEDIKQNGLINPPTVVQTEDGKYRVIAGRRRIEAVRLLKWKEVTVKITFGDEERLAAISLSENVNRLEMNPLDEAETFYRMLQSGTAIEEISRRYDRSISAIYQRIKLMDLTEEIKALMRDGKMDLVTAAMLESLNEDQQRAFAEKYQKKEHIGKWDASEFLNKVQHDELYGFLEDKKCKACKTRTRYNDKALFPELDGHVDATCLDHDCYIKKWAALLDKEIQPIKTEHPESLPILATQNSDLRKIFGKALEIKGQEYEIRSLDYETRVTGKPTKKDFPCYRIDINYDGELELSAIYYREKQKEKKSEVKPGEKYGIRELLDKPKEELQVIDTALDKKYDNDSWQYTRDLRRKFLIKAAGRKALAPDDEKALSIYCRQMFDKPNDLQREIYKLYTGESYSEKPDEWGKLSIPKLFELLSTLRVERNSYLPSVKDIKTAKEPIEIQEFFELSLEDFIALYREAAEELIADAQKPAEKKVKTETESSKEQIDPIEDDDGDDEEDEEEEDVEYPQM